MNLAISLIIIGSLQVTSYRSVYSQTDNTPYNTSTGEHVSPDGVAISQDMLCPICKKEHKRCKNPSKSEIHYNDWLYIQGVGLKRVNDVMNKRHKNHLDVWVSSLDEEKTFFKEHHSNGLVTFKLQENFSDKETYQK